MRKNSGITLIEILMVVSIIIVLAGLLIPVMSVVRRTANETKQKAELNTIEIALLAFKSDYGDYPPSSEDTCRVNANDYSGAQKLAEALCGWDLLGFHPDSVFKSDGRNCESPIRDVYRRSPLVPTSPLDLQNLRERKGPYIDMTKIGAFKINSLFNTVATINGDTYVICDTFGIRNLIIGGKNIKAGTPILYYKANTNSKNHNTGNNNTRIYNYDDNKYVIDLRKLTADGSQGTQHFFDRDPNGVKYFYDNYIQDNKTPTAWPQRPDSYLLISAGADGEYGTRDDICNFEHP